MQLMRTISNRLLNAVPGWIQYILIKQRWKQTFWNFSFESLSCGILFSSKQWLSCLLWQGLEQRLVEIRSKWAETAEAIECLWGLWLFKNCKLGKRNTQSSVLSLLVSLSSLGPLREGRKAVLVHLSLHPRSSTWAVLLGSAPTRHLGCCV